jgi:hypothetical protein
MNPAGRHGPEVRGCPVPTEVGRAALRSALVAAGYAVSLSEAGVAFGNHSLLPQAQWPPAWASEGRADELSYSKLVAYAEEPHRVTVALAAPLWASATLVARSLGLSLSSFVTGLIEAGVGAYGGSSPGGEGGGLEGGGEPGERGEAARPSARPRTGRLRVAVRGEGQLEGQGKAGVASTGETGGAGEVVEGPGPAGAGTGGTVVATTTKSTGGGATSRRAGGSNVTVTKRAGGRTARGGQGRGDKAGEPDAGAAGGGDVTGGQPVEGQGATGRRSEGHAEEDKT